MAKEAVDYREVVKGVNLCSFRMLEIRENLVSIAFNIIYYHPIILMQRKSKGSHGGSSWRKVYYSNGKCPLVA